jgi:hypothetical protein
VQRLPNPHLTSRNGRLFPHRSPRQSSANAAQGGLTSPPRRATPEGQLLHLSRSTTSRNLAYIKAPLCVRDTRTRRNPHEKSIPCGVPAPAPPLSARSDRPRWEFRVFSFPHRAVLVFPRPAPGAGSNFPRTCDGGSGTGAVALIDSRSQSHRAPQFPVELFFSVAMV